MVTKYRMSRRYWNLHLSVAKHIKGCGNVQPCLAMMTDCKTLKKCQIHLMFLFKFQISSFSSGFLLSWFVAQKFKPPNKISMTRCQDIFQNCLIINICSKNKTGTLHHQPISAVTSKMKRSTRSGLFKMEGLPKQEN